MYFDYHSIFKDSLFDNIMVFHKFLFNEFMILL